MKQIVSFPPPLLFKWFGTFKITHSCVQYQKSKAVGKLDSTKRIYLKEQGLKQKGLIAHRLVLQKGILQTKCKDPI